MGAVRSLGACWCVSTANQVRFRRPRPFVQPEAGRLAEREGSVPPPPRTADAPVSPLTASSPLPAAKGMRRPHERSKVRATLVRLLRAGLLTGVIDGLWAIGLAMAYGRSIPRLWQGVAAVPFGERMLDGGAATVALGITLHFCVALGWSAVFLLLLTRWRWLAGVVESRPGRVIVV